MRFPRPVCAMLVVVLSCQGACWALDEPLRSAIAHGDLAKARGLSARQDRPSAADETVVSGYAHLLAGDYRAATAAFGRVCHQSDRELEAAVSSFDLLTKEYDKSWAAHLLLADVLVRAGHRDQALAAATKAVGLNGRAAIAHHVRGLIHALAGRDELALADFEQAIGLDPNLADAHVARAVVQIHRGRPDLALADADAALRLLPDFAAASNVRGVALCQQGRHEDAIRAFVFALDLDPESAAAARNLQAAKLLAVEGRTKVRIAIQTGSRKGAIGVRTLELVVAPKAQAEQAAAAASAVLQAATGEGPVVAASVEQAVSVLQAGKQPVVLAVPMFEQRDSAQRVPSILRSVAQQTPNAQVRITTDGRQATEAVATVIEAVVAQPELLARVGSWDAVVAEPGPVDAFVRAALSLRAQGVAVRAYGPPAVYAGWQTLPAPQQAALPFFLTPAVSPGEGTPLPISAIPMITPQVAASAVQFPEQARGGLSHVCLCTSSGGGVGVHLALPNRTPQGLRPGGTSVPAGGGINVGVSRGGTPQVTITGTKQPVQIRLDLRDGHVNVESDNNNLHEPKGVPLRPQDRVVVDVGGGKVRIEVNGNTVRELNVPAAQGDQTIQIEWQPDGTATVRADGEIVGQVEIRPDGTGVIRVGDKVIEVQPPQRPQQGDKRTPGSNQGQGTSGGKGGQNEGSGSKGNSAGERTASKTSIPARDPRDGIIADPLPEPDPGDGIIADPLPERDPRDGIIADPLPERDPGDGVIADPLPERDPRGDVYINAMPRHGRQRGAETSSARASPVLTGPATPRSEPQGGRPGRMQLPPGWFMPMDWTVVPSADGFSFVQVLDPRRWGHVPVLTVEAEKALQRQAEERRNPLEGHEYIPVPHLPPQHIDPVPPLRPQPIDPGYPVVRGPIDRPAIDPAPGTLRPGGITSPPPDPVPFMRGPRQARGQLADPTKRGGVFLGDSRTTEVIDGRTAGTGVLFGKKGTRPKTEQVQASLECPLLVFQRGIIRE